MKATFFLHGWWRTS
ncbi:trp operon leader peptide [Citrobacter freundii]|nr:MULTISPECIES: trp operon leader peptide [Enterobacteriaceae]EJG2170833.1 trp operon leader peptide [Citrobacter freundii 47N]MBJ8869288.1 trp operon leader peptide [Citrobacter braakii]MDT3758716.1 trp operon leader peptide [Citrobacter freundii complex sp. 2023EL-00962]MDU2467201.1 trp operon leader peptide [Veillonella sp.]EIC2132311.1 trp operon leader peptide [Citrobacter freundii]